MATITPPTIKAQAFPDFGKYLTFLQSIKSNKALEKGINNMCNAEQYANMVKVYQHIYRPICDEFGILPVTSFFRTKALNTALGGSLTSDHMLGRAIDIDCDLTPIRVNNSELFAWAKKHLKYDQLILEHPDLNNKPAWVHLSWRSEEENRNRELKAVWQKQKSGRLVTVYQEI